MERLKLSAAVRVAGSRKSGKEMIPGVVYGSKTPAHSVWVSAIEFGKIFSQAGENTLVELQEEGGSNFVVLIHDVQHSPLRNIPTHVDFFAVNMKEEVEAAVPLEFVGVSAAIKEEGGVLVRNMEEIAVRCLPADIPKSFVVNLEKLATFDDCIYVKDIVHSEKYEALVDGESAVALVARPRKEEVEVVASGTPEQSATSAPAAEEPKK